MKIIQEEKQFKPITIVIESYDELAFITSAACSASLFGTEEFCKKNEFKGTGNGFTLPYLGDKLFDILYEINNQ